MIHNTFASKFVKQNNGSMKKSIKQLTMALIFLIGYTANAQEWSLVPDLPAQEFTMVKNINGKLYASSGNKLFTTSDGTHWNVESITNLTSITPNCMTRFNNVLYIGTLANGLYYRNISGGPWHHTLAGINVSSFAVHNNTLYISSEGFGVWMNNAGTWENCTYDLPTYSYNVNKIVTINGELLALSGANGTFYRYNPNIHRWKEDYYLNTYAPGLAISDALLLNQTLLVANGTQLLRSEDNGENWTADRVGLLTGVNRILYQGSNNIYVLTMTLSNYTRLQKRNTNAASQSSWAQFTEQLPFYSYAIEEYNGRIYIASHLGVYTKLDNTLEVDNPPSIKDEIKVYPIPSNDGNFYITGTTTIEKIEVYDLNGRLVEAKHASAGTENITISNSGMYLLKITGGGQTITKKVMVL